MTRAVGTCRSARKILVVAVVSAALILVPALQWPANAQQGWAPAPAPGQAYGQPQPYGQPYGQPYAQPYGQPYYAPPAVDVATATAQAVNDARADTSGAIWFFAGCVLSWIGILIAYVVDPSPPPARLMGKSPEYLGVYLAAYKNEARSIQGHAAIWGTVTAVAVSVVLIIIFVSALRNAQTMNNAAAIMSTP